MGTEIYDKGDIVDGWYSVRTLFWHRRAGRIASSSCYEERITLWQADSAQHAAHLAEQEGREYASDVDARWCDLVQVYELQEHPRAQGAEVFSLMRDSDLDELAYVTRFLETGQERTGTLGPQAE